MNRLQKLFDSKKANILSIFFTAGFPKRDDTMEIVRQLDAAGADLLEIGFPFSDPLADGPVIQHSSQTAIRNGMTLSLLFRQLETLRDLTEIPVLLMGYLNPVIQFGPAKFVARSAEVGVDGFIIPDLPQTFYEREMKTHVVSAGLARIRLIAPGDSDDRIREIDRTSDGFNYVVSSNGTTGRKSAITGQAAYFERVRKLTRNPSLIGFGVCDRSSFDEACKYAQGAIVGSEIIRQLEMEDSSVALPAFVNSMIS